MITQKIYGPWMEKTQMEKIRQILEKTRPEGKILDVGCGPGFLERFVDAVATDVDMENLKEVSGPKALCSGDDLPFDDKSFDWVFCIDTVHLLKGTVDLERVGKKIVLSAFCNENNCQEKLEWLKSLVKGEIEKEFFVKGEKEWDAVIVYSAE